MKILIVTRDLRKRQEWSKFASNFCTPTIPNIKIIDWGDALAGRLFDIIFTVYPINPSAAELVEMHHYYENILRLKIGPNGTIIDLN